MKTDTCPDFVRIVTELLVAAFGGRLASVVQLGSLAHGGFSERFSDIDVAVILHEPVADEFLEALKRRIGDLDPAALAQRVSLFWTVPDFSWGQLRPVDRVDLHDNGRLLWGKPLEGLAPRPSLEAVREDMRVSSLPYWSEKTRYFAGQLPATESEFKEFLRCLLYPARLMLTWQTGRLGSNDEAVEFIETAAIPGLRLDMIRDALRCRRGDIGDARLFRYRPELIPQRAATLAWLGLDQDTLTPLR